jgi:hypothetical protein
MIAFCANCKYYKGKECTHKTNKETTINWEKQSFKIAKTAADINSNNNCKNYDDSVFYKVKRFIFKNCKK